MGKERERGGEKGGREINRVQETERGPRERERGERKS